MTRRAGYQPLPLPEGLKLDPVRSIRFDVARNRIVVVCEPADGMIRVHVVARDEGGT